MTRIETYRYPQDEDSPEVKKMRKLAAQAGRSVAVGASEKKIAQGKQARRKLDELMGTLSDERLLYWSQVLMIDPRWNGATGQGGFWAAGTEAVNQSADQEIGRRQRS